MRVKTRSSGPKKLRLSRETLAALGRQDLGRVAGGAPTENSPACQGFSEPSLCPTCLCTR